MKRIVPIGKRIKGVIYFHRHYIHHMIFEYKLLTAEDFQKAGRAADLKHDEYDVIKWNSSKRKLTFISCPSFYTKFEPEIEKTMTVDLCSGEVTTRRYRKNPPIYHHTWLMVSDDDPYMNVARAKMRSADIEECIKALQIEKRLIGYKKYWSENQLGQGNNSI